MIEPQPHPSRLLRWTAGIARWSLGLLLAFWLLLATMWGVLHGFIVPRISEYRPQLESLAARTLGVPVRIGAITARSEGLMPVIELGQVALLDARGQPALELPRVVIGVSPRSLLRLGVEQLYIDAPLLEARRDGAGQLWIAGLALPTASEGNSPAADWLFSQTEIAIRSGQLRWTDELRQAPPLSLRDLDLVVRNQGRRHQIRLDATPDSEWGSRFTLAARLRAPLLSVHEGDWRRWSGQAYAHFAQLDVARLGQYIDLQGASVSQGRGALRAWVDVQRGQIQQVTTDLMLSAVETRLRPDLPPLTLHALQGRLSVARLPGGYALHGQSLAFETGDGLRWPAGRFSLRHIQADAAAAEHGALGELGELRFEQFDLAIAAQLASRLPIADAARSRLQALAPRGQVKALQAHWRGPIDKPLQYEISGEVQDLALSEQPAAQGTGVPGVEGLQAKFSLNQLGGSAQLGMTGGTLRLPGVFEEPVLALDHLSGALRWQLQGEQIEVQARDLRFSNADAEGQAQASWHTGRDAATRFPGVLALTGTLRNADGSRVHRYLPLEIPADARHYVRDSVQSGRASRVQFKVQGDLAKLPFERPGEGEFHIAADVHDVNYVYVPPGLQSAGDKPWPALTQLSGELVFDRASMAVRNAQGRVAGHPRLQLQQIQARIPDLSHTRVDVQARAQGELAEMLGFVAGSPVAALTEQVLDHAQGSGTAQLQLHLDLPIDHLEQSKVQGSVALAGNSLRLMPEVPLLSQIRGSVQFSDTGFSLSGVQAQALGGPVRFEGGMQVLPPSAPASQSPLALRASGTASAEGLRAAPELGLLADIARAAQGQADYVLDLGVRRGTPEITVTSNLQGLALDLPSPLGKTAPAALALRFAHTLAPSALATPAAHAANTDLPPLHDEIALQWGELASLRYLRDAGSTPAKVLRGALAIGSPLPAIDMPERGVHAQVALAAVDIDAWLQALQRLAPVEPSAPAEAATTASLQSYLPDTATLSARSLTINSRTLHALSASGTRNGGLWNASVEARELSGQIEYREGHAADPAGQVHARLARLAVPQSAAGAVDALLSPQPRSLPALDIAVEALELFGRPMGRFEVQARNRQSPTDPALREWQLTQFNITSPEARLQASGSWALQPGQPAQPRTALRFALEINDTGALLSRFSMPGVIRNGRGRLDGQVAWNGSPLAPDYHSMNGQMHLDMASGQFLQAEPGLAKLLGVLSLQALPRRLTLDFRDVFSKGFAFDFVRGDVQIAQGIARTNNLQMKGVNAAVLMEGEADMHRETQNLHVVVVPEINVWTASLVATAINPVVGLSSFLAQMLLRGPLIAATTKEFRIDGSWSDPQVNPIPSTPESRASVPPPTTTGVTSP
ncbi:YhdP family protein [Pantoea sp. 18069]|uniref:YhdP family protein n=1 Tax=Pantoea sp. 18069 TaxID=2681415 RepID=UPI001356F362|nr:YhdP family protein [Pantoea sp. 18069]